jgi:tetratricopeptide (TPR) repeat protein
MSPGSALALVLFGASFSEQMTVSAGKERPAAIEEVRAWVAANPSDPEAGRALVWLGQLELADEHYDAAGAFFEQAVRAYPGTEWDLAGTKGLADLALWSHRYAQAVAHYQKLEQSSSPYFKFLGAAGVEEARATRVRDLLALGLAALLLSLAGLRLYVARPWPLPEELIYAAPVAALMVLASFSQPADEGRAVAAVALGGWLLLGANAAYYRARPPKGLTLAREALLSVAQAAALVYCAVVANGLWGKLVVTLVVGPE